MAFFSPPPLPFSPPSSPAGGEGSALSSSSEETRILGRHPPWASLGGGGSSSVVSLTEDELSDLLVVGLREGLEALGDMLGLLEGSGEQDALEDSLAGEHEVLGDDEEDELGMLKELVLAFGCGAWGIERWEKELVLGTGRRGCWCGDSCTLGEGGLDLREPVGLGDGLRLPRGEWEVTNDENGDSVAASDEAMADVIWWPSPFFSLSLPLLFSFSFSFSFSLSLSSSFFSLKLSVLRRNVKFLSLLKLT